MTTPISAAPNRSSPARPDAPPRNILVRSVNWLGDAVLTTPALQRLREALPQTRLTLLTAETLAELWTHHPSLDAVVTFARGESVWRVSRRLRPQRYDLALLFPNSLRSALETWLAGIPRRVGYTRTERNWLLTQRIPQRSEAVPMRKRGAREVRRIAAADDTSAPAAIPREAHHVYQYLHLVAALGACPDPRAPCVAVTDDDRLRVRSLLPASGQGATVWLGMNAGGEYGPAKRWPRERFVTAAIELHRRLPCGWILFGGARDVALASDLESALRQAAVQPVVNLANRTSLRDLCAALTLCRVLLTNDSGPMHLAAAVGTPVVALFGSTSPELTGPFALGPDIHRVLSARVACAPCFRRTCPIDIRCLQRLEVAQVVAAVLEIARLDQTG